MNSNAFVPPVRRTAAALTAAALAAAPVLLAGAAPAYASGGDGKAGAVVLRADLGVSLLDRTRVPLNVTLNEVQAPESARETLLTARVKGAHQGRPVTMLDAKVATADATTGDGKAEGRANLVNARVSVPGLNLKHRPLIELDQVTSTAVCAAGQQPQADSKIPGHVTVLGKRIELSASGTARADVEGVGSVRLDLAKTSTTATTAAATALKLQLSVTPERLDVAAVEGTITLVEATCESPAGGSGDGEPEPGTGDGGATEGATGGSGGSGDGSGDGSGSGDGDGVSTQTGTGNGDGNLAATGGNSSTPYLAAGAGALLAAGGVSVFVARRRAAARRG
ncbi:LPXTG cell wall anchor domain-containing protein [Streptomyces sp. F63]|uniref:SCO1860 family LAETG-anchored protein n=1 Tax=Streptomyces sp. F63 TaxID=2824887 RepID=UPI001B35E42C|nr:SCO1860 family LAETG-anchored protein [Streptomyces sp. F63]MBQ0986686.1 LPXTG cell wall anchor domain-containing protein [Streptomyces sp. F63]